MARVKRVSVLIPAHNARDHIQQTVESVLCQDWPDIEIVVVDDGSTDGTLEQVHKLKISPAKLRLIHQCRSGASAARNTAFRHSSGDYIQYLDADDVLGASKIAVQMSALAGSRSNSIASSQWGYFWSDPHVAEYIRHECFRSYAAPSDWLVESWHSGSWMPLFAWLVPRPVIEKAGPWNELLTLDDDGEFFTRVILASSEIIYCSDAKALYRKGIPTSLSSILNASSAISEYVSIEMREKHLLTRRQDVHARGAAADLYQRFIYRFYPMYPELLQEAALQVAELGGSGAQPASTPAFKVLDRLLGWRFSKRIQEFVYKHGLNPAAWKGRTR